MIKFKVQLLFNEGINEHLISLHNDIISKLKINRNIRKSKISVKDCMEYEKDELITKLNCNIDYFGQIGILPVGYCETLIKDDNFNSKIDNFINHYKKEKNTLKIDYSDKNVSKVVDLKKIDSNVSSIDDKKIDSNVSIEKIDSKQNDSKIENDSVSNKDLKKSNCIIL
jgi:hypothetical protein